ncbi:MAG: NAD(P)-binding protein [Pseudomonadota bacterium]
MKRIADHDIIVSDLDALDSILKEYAATNRAFVVVSREKEENLPLQLQEVLDHGNYLHGDATRDETLEKAGIKKAESIIIATGDDSFNMYVLVTAKSLNPGLNKIVRINNVENSSKFTSVGADRVLPAASIIGQMLTQAAFNPVSHRFLVALTTHTQDPFLEDVHPGKEDIGKKVLDLYKRPIVLSRDGKFIVDIEEEKLKDGDVIIKTHNKFKS